jgi:D-glycero-alpha-D-manno-heptose-7-phosphate kinase
MAEENGPRVVVCAVPLRISFAGGGTDLAEFYTQEDGAVLSTSIDRFVYVTVKRHSEIFGQRYRLNYSETELAGSIDEIQNDIIRESLRMVPIDSGLYISTVADLPASSGLGSSSAFAVGLLQALHQMRGERITLAELAEEACRVEIEVLKRPIGKQDQYATAFGGLNQFTFQRDGTVSIEPQALPANRIRELFDSLLLLWTGIVRQSKDILEEQKRLTGDRMAELREIKNHCFELKAQLRTGFDPIAFGGVLDETWARKRKLASTITSDRIDAWYARAREAGAIGGKIAGAGGGGFLMLIVPPSRRAAVCRALPELTPVPIRYEESGTRVLIPLGH